MAGILACIALFGSGCSGTGKPGPDEFIIDGKIANLEDGTVVNLQRVREVLATDTVKNGRFAFRWKVEGKDPEQLMITTGYDLDMFLLLWGAPGEKIKVRGEGKLYPLWEVTSSIPYQIDANGYMKADYDIFAQSVRNNEALFHLRQKRLAASSEEERAATLEEIYLLQDRNDSLAILSNLRYIPIMESSGMTPEWHSKLRGLAVRLMRGGMDPETEAVIRTAAVEQYARLSEEERNSRRGEQIASFIFPRIPEIGDKMVDGDLFKLEGGIVRLADYGGKYLMLDFWAITCGPCLMSFPEIKAISEKYKDKLNVMSINLDDDETWKKALTEHEISWINVRDPKKYGGLASGYGVFALPHYVLISPDGTVADMWTGYSEGSLSQDKLEYKITCVLNLYDK